MPARSARSVDPIIHWPSVTGGLLSASIGDMQRLNPELGLRCAISTWQPDWSTFSESTAAQMRKDMAESGPSEYLVYDGASLDVVTIVMPEPPTDDSMSGFTDLNREGGICETDLGVFRFGPRRIERGADGSLIIRPRSEAVNRMADCFAAAYQGRLDDREDELDWVEYFRRMPARWGVFRDPNELWEVEFAWCGDDFLQRPKSNHDYWRTKPIGTISYIDAYDLPIEAHYERARAIIAAGSEFAIVSNIDTADALVFRLSGVERFTKSFRIAEWPWFEVPVRSL
jgi:hypothetical protein